MSDDSEPIVTTVEELAAHDRRIKAEAWAEGHEAGHREGLFTGMEPDEVARRARERAEGQA